MPLPADEITPDALIVTFSPAENRPRSIDSGNSIGMPLLFRTASSVVNKRRLRWEGCMVAAICLHGAGSEF